MRPGLERAIEAAVKQLYSADVSVELTRPEEQFGDYATNIALQLSNKVGQKPHLVAEQLAEQLRGALKEQLSEIYVAGPGFLNLRLSNQSLVEALDIKPEQALADKTVVVEYADPNPFKVLHAGHLYTSIVGDSIANLLENAGANVHRVNFGGDVGLHVARSMWAILKYLGGEYPEKLGSVAENKRADWLSEHYVEGSEAYENNEQAKTDIVKLNKQVYQLVSDNDHDSPLARIYWTCRQWSYDYFNAFYAEIGIKFEKYYPESETAPIGLQTVQEQLARGVYEKSDGAIIFNGEKYGLHTRVFISSAGLPTYEAKDVGLSMAKWHDYHFDKSVIITGNDIIEYMKVVLKSLEQFEPQLAADTVHLTHGIVKLKGGVKMSSRKGNILRAVDVLEVAREANKTMTGQDNEDTVIGAVKYAFLKNRLGGDIIYDPEESVSLEGNSGPYLQYAHARAKSILAKAKQPAGELNDLEAEERSLLRKITEYPEVLEKATAELMPHHICTYLYELAQKFNSFYEHNRVIGDSREPIRLKLVDIYANTLKDGLNLLGISAPDKM